MTIFCTSRSTPETLQKIYEDFFSGECLNFRGKLAIYLREDPFFWGGNTCAVCPWSLAFASSIPVLGLERVCLRKVGPWPWPRIFLEPWPQALCPRLHLSLRVSKTCITVQCRSRFLDMYEISGKHKHYTATICCLRFTVLPQNLCCSLNISDSLSQLFFLFLQSACRMFAENTF